MMIVVLLLSLLAGVVLAEISMRVFGGQWFRAQLCVIRENLQAFQDAVGDDARQAALMRSGVMTLQFSLLVLAVLVVLAVIAFVAPWLLGWTESQQTVYVVAVSVAASGWWLLRRPCNSSSTQSPVPQSHAYGFLERSLHWLALEPAVVRQLTFDLERQFALPKRTTQSNGNDSADPADGAVYVCGLARSGTTMLLRILDELGDFRSLTYRDMPFVLAPNLWKQISRYARQESVARERAHGDGIHVGFDSPEGFEEVFWHTFGTRTPDQKCLGIEEPSHEALSSFSDYRALVANPRTEPVPENGIMRRYLSKNNNNLLRLGSLCADPTATVLLVYRNPIATARSLHRQHQRFCASQAGDRFTRRYMGWLSHYEFGLDHRPLCFAVPRMDTSLTPEDPNYWLDYWNAVYLHVLAQSDLRFRLVSHDRLRADPAATLDAIFAELGVQVDSAALALKIDGPDDMDNDGFCPEMLRLAEGIYRELQDSPKNLRRSAEIVSLK